MFEAAGEEVAVQLKNFIHEMTRFLGIGANIPKGYMINKMARLDG